MSEFTLSVAIPRPLDGLFTYKISSELIDHVRVGGLVKVPFGRGITHAFVVELPKPISDYSGPVPLEKLKSILEVDPQGSIFTDDVFALCKWAHDYYCAPWGEVLHCAAPPAALGLKNTKKAARALGDFQVVMRNHELTSDQKAAFQILEDLRLRTQSPKVGVLNGVTGSGKTELYIELARKTLAEGKGVLLLVPEIALTSQLHRRFEESLGVRVGLWHSAVADGKRRDEGAAIRSGELKAVIGARSAIFAPIQNLGLIVIDEEHDPTYKQEDRVRYHARDLAVVRSKLTGALVVLGSATPSIESRERVREGRYLEARLEHRIAAGGLPAIEIVDLCNEEKVEGTQAILAKKTVDAIRETVLAGDQVIVFLNRRGFAAFLICQDCGEVKGCPNCSISLTVHRKNAHLRCHVCGHQELIPDICFKCHGDKLEAMGAGTESLEADLPRLIPEVKPLRLDRDQITSATRLEKILDSFRAGEANLLLGTQMLVKGHDFPRVTLVVVIMADALFRWPDFRSAERAFQIIKQVSGRAGRGERPGKVLIQSFDTDHPVLQTVMGIISEDSFLEGERQLRLALGYPPFGRLARIRFESADRGEAENRATEIAQLLTPLQNDGKIELLGPSEAFLERAKGIYRWDLLVKAHEIQGLQRAILRSKDACLRQRWQFLVDVDPYGVG